MPDTPSPAPASKPWTLLLDPATDTETRERLAALFPGCDIHAFAVPGDLPPLGAGDRVACWLPDETLPDLLLQAVDRDWALALLPHPGLIHARTGYNLSADLDAAAADILGAEQPAAVDLLLCDGQPVLNTVVIARGFAVSPDSSADARWRTRLLRAWRLLRHLGALRLLPVTLATQKDRRLDTAAFGIVALLRGRSSLLTRRLLEDAPSNDGMLHALIVAPRSLGQLLQYVLTSLQRRRPGERLPSYMGHIRTDALTISGKRPLEYVRDGVAVASREIRLQVMPGALQLLGPARSTEAAGDREVKEVVRAQSLPVGEAAIELASRPLPLVMHAGSEEFRELFPTLRENARASRTFVTLMLLATLLAALGLFANSAPVIIGAMVLAPLMAPIISLAMGVLRQDERLIRTAVRTLVIGVLLALGCAALLTLLMPLHSVNAEIGSRLRPTLLDLGIAVVSGMAGAYANARTEVAKSFAGVAIAVALVPPLAVAGIGIGWGDLLVFRGALLLFLTNLAGIVLAAALTFLVLGYSAFHVARRGLAASLLLVLAISVPLGLGFAHMVQEHRVVRLLQGFHSGDISVRDVSVLQRRPLLLSVTVVSPHPLRADDLAALKQRLQQRAGEPLTLQVSQALLY